MLKPVIITPGDPAGIGPEIALKAWANGARNIVIMGHIPHLRAIAEKLGLCVEFCPCDAENSAQAGDKKCLVSEISWPEFPQPGHPNDANSPVIINAIAQAVKEVKEGKYSALVTNPIAKECLYKAGFEYPGHTEFLAALDGGQEKAVMMLANDQLRVVPLTIHVPLSNAETLIDKKSLYQTLDILIKDLQSYFGLTSPNLAVAGLNPHAGEKGHIGRFEQDFLIPALKNYRAVHATISGPFSADSLFHTHARKQYDAVLCMYHDQALIPVKTIDFFGTTNITLGLSFIRCSPDHGTAFDRASVFSARPDSLMAAIKAAQSMAIHKSGKKHHE